jgi:preprotein translocase subunit SecG
MMILRVILIAVEVITSVLLIGIILIQKAKGGGLGLAFGGGGADSLFGSRAGNVLTKGTIILAIVFMVNTVLLGILHARSYDRTLMDGHRPAMTQPSAQPPASLPVDTQATQTAPPPATADEQAVTVDLTPPVSTMDVAPPTVVTVDESEPVAPPPVREQSE